MPWEIIHVEHFEKDAEAFRRERQIKGWTRVKKEALIRGDVDNLKKLSKRRTFWVLRLPLVAQGIQLGKNGLPWARAYGPSRMEVAGIEPASEKPW